MPLRRLHCAWLLALCTPTFAEIDRRDIAASSEWESLIQSGVDLRDAGHLDEAEAKFNAAAVLAEDLLPHDERRAVLLNHQGTVCHLRGQYRQAIALFQDGARIYEQNPAGVPSAITGVWSNLATSYRRSGRLEEASTYLQRALEMERSLYPRGDPRTSVILVGIAWVAMEQGRYDTARKIFDEELENLKRQHAPLTSIAMVIASQGHLHSKCGEYPLAESCYRRALEMRRKALPRGHVEIYRTMSSLPVILTEASRNEQAERLLRQSLAGMEASPLADPGDLAIPLSNLAYVLADSGHDAEAEPMARRALTIYESQQGRTMETLAVRQTLAMILLHRGKRDEAEQMLLESLRFREKLQGVDHPDLVRTIQNLAVLYTEEKRYQQAEPLFQRAIALAETRLGRAHHDLAIVLFSYSHMLKSLKRGKEAAAVRKRAEEVSAEANVGRTGTSTVDIGELGNP